MTKATIRRATYLLVFGLFLAPGFESRGLAQDGLSGTEKLAAEIPQFGGAFFDKQRVLNVYLTDLSVANAMGSVAPTAAQVVDRISQHAAVALPTPTVDTFKSGDPNTRVRGIAVTMMATLDVLKRAAANGDNFVITHEPTFYSHRDTLGVLEAENDVVLAAKEKFIAEHGLIIWRFHDTPHRMQPDMITKGVIHALGWETKQHNMSGQLFDLAPTTLGELASTVTRRLGANATRIIGDPKSRVSKVGLTEGFPGFVANRHVFQNHDLDVMVIGEDHEWEMIEYAVDAIEAGQLKGMIVVGHIPSEQAGMEEVTRWLKTFITGVPIHFVSTRDPFRPLK